MDRDAVLGKKNSKTLSSAHLDPNWVKNNDYRDGFRNLMRIVNLQAVVIVSLAAIFTVYVWTDVSGNRYFAEAQENRRMQMVDLKLPNMGRTALVNWVIQATSQVMTFGFNDIDERFAISRQNFTAEGWAGFSKAMKDSKLIESVMKAQQLITTVPLSPPVLKEEGMLKGAYSWVFEIDLLMTFRSGSVKRPVVKTLRVVVEQVPTRDNPFALGIAEWYMY